MCFCHKHSCLEKTNKVVRNFLSLEQEFLISCYGAAMLAMLADATSSCPKAMNSSYTCYMTMYVLTNRSAALHTFQLTNQKKMIKWSNLLAPCLPRWWKQIHMHVQCLPWAHPIRIFSLRRACQAEKIIKSRDFKLLLRKHVYNHDASSDLKHAKLNIFFKQKNKNYNYINLFAR